MAGAGEGAGAGAAGGVAPQLRVNNPQETSLDVWWDKVDNATAYFVQVKTIEEEWDAARSVPYGPESCKQTVEGLLPTTTYELRLVVETDAGKSQPGASTVADTLVANCGPKCTIQ